MGRQKRPVQKETLEMKNIVCTIIMVALISFTLGIKLGSKLVEKESRREISLGK